MRWPKGNPPVRQLEGSQDHMHAVRNTGEEGIMQYRLVDCGCISCTTHHGECQDKNYADPWITVNLLPHKKKNISQNLQISEWFKPLGSNVENDVSGELMEYGDEEECEINHDEIESDEDEDANDECDERDINDNSLHEENPTEIDEHYVNGSDADEGDSEHYVNDSGEGNINNSSNEELGPHEHDVSEEDSLIELFSEEYISSDEDISDDREPVYADEIPSQINEEDPNINFNWKKLGEDMTAYCTFTAMKNFINRKKLPNANVLLKWVMAEEDIIDTIALKFWPMDGPRNHVPIETFGEGNCGPRALAHLLLGNQSHYREVRI